jgi:hypothetical protein
MARFPPETAHLGASCSTSGGTIADPPNREKSKKRAGTQNAEFSR